MPVPKYPKPNEERNDYISRCVESIMKEGKTREQALGQCFGMWRAKGKKGVHRGDRGGSRRRQIEALEK